ncbi:MAG: phosphomannomutase/phosphoglucomutase [Planctomycetota bacterium]
MIDAVFKAYDIRGIYEDQIDETLAEQIGRAFVAEVAPKSVPMKVVVGHDMRPCAPSITAALVRGLTRAGADVTRIGLCSTPMLSFATGNGGFDGGIMVTASHNPAQYIGLKLARAECVPLSRDAGIGAMGELIKSGNLPADAATPGTVTDMDVREDYVSMVTRHVKPGRRLKIVADAGNGMGGFEFPLVMGRLDLDVTPLYFELDGTFPNHEANPLALDTLKVLRETVVREGADFGVAFDGDADRAGFVDEKGEVVTNDLATALLASDILSRDKGPVVYDLRSSRALPEEIEKHGGTPVRERVGHSFMKKTMREKGCVFGGEFSGHYYFRENYNTESASLAVVALCNILASGDTTLSERLAPLRRYRQTGEVNFEVEDKPARMQAIADAFPDAEIDWLDGVTCQYPGWWCNVRPSNTEPLLRLNLEATDPTAFEAAREKVFEILGTPVEH